MRMKRTWPNIGDRKIITKFLWWPLRLAGRSLDQNFVETRWLEQATVEYQFRHTVGDIYSRHVCKWVPIRFI